MQRKMVRFTYGMDFRAHVGNKELASLSWLTIPDRVTFFRVVHIFKIRHKFAPGYLSNYFTPISHIHGHNTRGSSLNFQMSKDLALTQNGFAYLATKEWNGLPHDLKMVTDLKIFKRRLKSHLFSRYD